MSRPVNNLRLFVGAYPDAETAAELLSRVAALALPSHRATPPDLVHLTVQFIGDVAERDLDAVIESAERAAAGIGPFELCLDELVTLPAGPRPRLLAAGTSATPAPLRELHSRLARRLAGKARVDPADRFTPHLTLARFDLTGPVPSVEPARSMPPIMMPVSSLRLMRSTLTHSGAKHHVVRLIPLT